MAKKHARLNFFSPFDLVVIGVDTKDGDEHPLFTPRERAEIDPSMVENIAFRGVLSPIGYTIIEEDKVVIDGKRRVLHARLANDMLMKWGHSPLSVPSYLHPSLHKSELMFRNVSGNSFKQTNDHVAQAKEALRLHKMGMDYQQLCIAFGWSHATLIGRMQIARSHESVQKALEDGFLSISSAMSIARITNHESQLETLEKLKEENVLPGKGATRRVRATCASAAAMMAPSKTFIKKMLASTHAKMLSQDTLSALSWAIGLEGPDNVNNLETVIKRMSPINLDRDRFKAKSE